jgi:hypothetical protein
VILARVAIFVRAIFCLCVFGWSFYAGDSFVFPSFLKFSFAELGIYRGYVERM